jgi:hypothetical protein
MGEMRHVTKFWYENLKGRDHGEDIGVNWRKILEWKSKNSITLNSKTDLNLWKT